MSLIQPFLNQEIQGLLGSIFGKDLKHIGKREVEPLLAVLQAIKVAYKDDYQIWQMLIQLLHDYLHYKEGFRLPRQKLEKYIDILLDKHPDYAQCLVSNLPNIKVPLLMGSGKREGGASAVDPSIFPSTSKRQKCEGQASFYNFATPAVKAYLASQGKPSRIIPTKCSKPLVQVPTFNIVTSAGTSQSNNTAQSPTAAMGNPLRLMSSGNVKAVTGISPQQEQRVHTMLLNHQNKMMKLEDANMSNLSQVEQTQLKMAIHRLQLQRKIAEHKRINQQQQSASGADERKNSGGPSLRVQMCGSNPPVYKVMRAQDVMGDEQGTITLIKDIGVGQDQSTKNPQTTSSKDGGEAVNIKQEVISPPQTPQLPVQEQPTMKIEINVDNTATDTIPTA